MEQSGHEHVRQQAGNQRVRKEDTESGTCRDAICIQAVQASGETEENVGATTGSHLLYIAVLFGRHIRPCTKIECKLRLITNEICLSEKNNIHLYVFSLMFWRQFRQAESISFYNIVE